MRWFVIAALAPASACTSQGGSGMLTALLNAKKFEATGFYTGVVDPGEKAELTEFVNRAIRDVAAMPEPRDAARVRDRLRSVVEEVDLYETEDRERAYSYLIETWRAAGFKEESRLFPVPDDRITLIR